MPYTDYWEFPTFIACILDIFAQLCIFAALYITAEYIFYFCILFKLVLIFGVGMKYTFHSNNYSSSYVIKWIVLLSIYQSGHYDITDSKALFAASIFYKIIYSVTATVG